MALEVVEPDLRKQLFKNGLDGLKGKLDKTEVTMVALALAWATIASHELGLLAERDKYLERLQSIAETGVNAEGMQPLFFNPVTKTLCRLADLIETLKKHITPPQLSLVG